MVLDYREAVKNGDTSRFLAGIPQRRICGEGRAKSIVVMETAGGVTACLSPISSGTLQKRSGGADWCAALPKNNANLQ
jgi:hypothetical protein